MALKYIVITNVLFVELVSRTPSGVRLESIFVYPRTFEKHHSMNFLNRLLKKLNKPVELTCPRCLGKGHVDNGDIIRLNMQGAWEAGTCAYCNGSGNIDETFLSKVPVNATQLTSDLSASEREALINNYNSPDTDQDLQKREDCPVSEQNRLWLEDAFGLLLDFFGQDLTRQRKVLIPHYDDFPIAYNGTEESTYETMKIIATQMEVPFESIELTFYDEGIHSLSTGSPFGSGIFLKSDDADKSSAGLYWGQTAYGRYEVWLNRNKLAEPENLVATLAHEIAHIKLLGEERMDENDEHLTDLTTVIFGLGIFNANAAFQTFTKVDSYGWQSQGYLSQPQWGYALALFAHLRGEESPAWIKHLTPNVKADFLQGQRFIAENPSLVFNGNS